MALPIIDTPTYDLKLVSSGETIKYRPFLVKEQKILLMSAEDGTPDAVMNGITQILQNCTFGSVDISKLPVFEVENIFLRLREKSVGEIAEFSVACTSDECKGTTQTKIDLRHLKIDETKIKSKTIELTSSLYVNMRYPTLVDLGVLKDLNSLDDNFKFLASCIESIEYNGELIDMSTTSRSELQEFIENLTQQQFELIKEFFADMPRMSGKLEYECSACGTHCERELSGLQNFLA
jgi:hypothetical protein